MSQRRHAVVRFYSGGMALAVASGVIAGVEELRDDVPHVSSLLPATVQPIKERTGSASNATWQDRVAVPAGEEGRVLRFRANGGSVEVAVDGPVAIRRISLGDVVPVAKGLAVEKLDPVMGFATIEEEVVALLDAQKLLPVGDNGE